MVRGPTDQLRPALLPPGLDLALIYAEKSGKSILTERCSGKGVCVCGCVCDETVTAYVVRLGLRYHTHTHTHTYTYTFP